MGGVLKDIGGVRFGRVVVTSRAGNTPQGQATWNCQCDCGLTTIARGADLRNGHTTSCGCYGQAVRSAAGVKARNGHGMSRTSVYAAWHAMMQRCENSRHEYYRHYGGRGIVVCERWHKFVHFYSDMGDTPKGGTLDRYPDNNGNYEPGNCRWATWQQQQNNRRDTVKIEFDGRTLSIAEWARAIGMSRSALERRIKSGWPIHAALTLSPNPNRRSTWSA